MHLDLRLGEERKQPGRSESILSGTCGISKALGDRRSSPGLGFGGDLEEHGRWMDGQREV